MADPYNINKRRPFSPIPFDEVSTNSPATAPTYPATAGWKVAPSGPGYQPSAVIDGAAAARESNPIDFTGVTATVDQTNNNPGNSFQGRAITVDPKAQAAGAAADLDRRESVMARRSNPTAYQPSGPQGAVIGGPADEAQRRLEIALSTTGRGSPSVREALVRNFGAQQQAELGRSEAALDRNQALAINNQRVAQGVESDNDDRSLRADAFNSTQRAARRGAAAAAPLAALEYAKTLAETRGLDARNQREAEAFDTEQVGKSSAYDDARIAELVKDGVPREQARTQVYGDALRSGVYDPGSRGYRTAESELTGAAAERINQTGLGDLVRSNLAGDYRAPYGKGRVAPASLDTLQDYSIDNQTGLLGYIPDFLGGSDNRIQGRGADGKSVTGYLSDAEAKQLREAQEYDQRNRTQRRGTN